MHARRSPTGARERRKSEQSDRRSPSSDQRDVAHINTAELVAIADPTAATASRPPAISRVLTRPKGDDTPRLPAAGDARWCGRREGGQEPTRQKQPHARPFVLHQHSASENARTVSRHNIGNLGKPPRPGFQTGHLRSRPATGLSVTRGDPGWSPPPRTRDTAPRDLPSTDDCARPCAEDSRRRTHTPCTSRSCRSCRLGVPSAKNTTRRREP